MGYAREDEFFHISENIANADTPGYKAQDIDFKTTLAQMTQAQTPQKPMARTHAAHLSPKATSWDTAQLKYRVPLMPALDGNTVDAQLEQGEFAQNSIQFLASLRFVNGSLKGLMTAIKGE